MAGDLPRLRRAGASLVSGRGADLRSALGRAYEAASLIEFEGKTFRRDIGARGLGRKMS